jgi:hypothetical protein
MFHIFRISIAAACLFAAAPAAAQGAHDWALDIQPGECTLNRAVMEPTPLLVSVWTRPGSDYNILVLASRDLPNIGGRSVPVSIRFGDTGPEVKGNGFDFPIRPEAGQGLSVRGLRADFLDGFARSSTMRVTIGGKTYGPFAIPKAGGAIRAFKGCVSDQLVEWGADPAQFAPGGKAPAPINPEITLTNRQLSEVADGGDTFHAVFRLSISPAGVVDGCTRIDGEKDRGAEKRGCTIMMGQKYAIPASDPQGKPVRGVLTFEIGLLRRRVRY